MIVYPPTAEDKARWDESAMRRRMLEGTWIQDIRDHLHAHLDASRAASWGPPTKAINLFRSVVQQVAVLYDEDPVVSHPDLDEAGTVYLRSLNLWGQARRHAQLVVGQRESLYRIEWVEGDHVAAGGLRLRVVPADCVVATCHPSLPSVPVRVEEARIRENPFKAGEKVVTWDIFDVSNPDIPIFKIEMEKEGKRVDVTNALMPDWDGTYRYRYPDTGLPFIPYILYHAADTGCLWDPYAWGELAAAALEVALLFTYWKHCVKEASYLQRYAIGLRLAGTHIADADDKRARARIATDPASVLMFEATDERGGSLGAFPAPVDPEKLIGAIVNFITTTMSAIGITGSDVQAVAGGASGVSITIRRDAVRALQKAFAPGFLQGDLELLKKVAAVSALFGEGLPVLPLTGWQIEYPSLPKTHEERTSERQQGEQDRADGRVSLIDLHRRDHPEMTPQEAAADLLRIRREEEALKAGLNPYDRPETSAIGAPGVEGGGIASAEKPADEVLTGVQLQAILDILDRVRLSALPPAAAIRMLILFFKVAPDDASALVDAIQVQPPAPTPDPEMGAAA